MNHADARSRMAGHLDGELRLDERALLDAHLDNCESCRTEFDELRATVHLLRTLPDPDFPPHLADDVLRRIRTGDIGGGFWDSLQARAREWISELSAPAIAVPATAMLAAFVVALGSGRFESVDASPVAIAASRSAEMPTIPREAQASAEQIFVDTGNGRARTPAAFRGLGTSGPTGPRQVPAASLASTGETVAPGVRVFSVPQGTGLAPVDPVPRNADDWLAVVLARPADFARAQAALSVAEREHWVRALSRRAVERGLAERIVAALEATDRPDSRSLARVFAAEANLPSSRHASPR